MKNRESLYVLDEFLIKHSELIDQKENILSVYESIRDAFLNGNSLYICGNGGSAADALHIVGELMKSFTIERPICDEVKKSIEALFPEDSDFLEGNLQGALPAYALHNSTSIETAFNNDVCADMVYAQQIYGYGKAGDVLLGISTTGNSKNIVNAVKVAKAKKIHTIVLTGYDGGKLKKLCNTAIIVPKHKVFEVQELHLPIYHLLCIMWEYYFFKKV